MVNKDALFKSIWWNISSSCFCNLLDYMMHALQFIHSMETQRQGMGWKEMGFWIIDWLLAEFEFYIFYIQCGGIIAHF